ncbi:hypothetical protein Tco_1058488 [Tanacetum coccineum]|uniref:Uncharacterized protein n=1 Tax=Tanacetum coccineum TaxID=301880 RepID=A0ABQ5H9A4_9ASTR
MAALKYKDDHNKIAYLGEGERGCKDFTDILSYLDTLRSWNQFPSSIATALILFVRGLGQPIPLTTPMLAIAAAGNDAAGGDDAANEDNAAANEAAGSSAEAHLVPHSPPVSPVREPTPERQPVSERPPSPSPTIPETEWVVPNPVSPVTDWRPWPSVPVHSPIRDPTPEPESPPTPPAQTFIFEEPLVFGPEPRPAGYVDPDVIEPIIFGPQPRPHGYVDPDFVEPIIFGPQPRPDNYLEPEDLDNIISMEDDTTHGGFHVCMGRIDSLETGAGEFQRKNYGGAFDFVSRVRMELEKTVKTAEGNHGLVVDASAAALCHDQPAVHFLRMWWNYDRRRRKVPLKGVSGLLLDIARTEFQLQLLSSFKVHMLIWIYLLMFLSEDAKQETLRVKNISERLVQRLRAEDLAQEDLPNVSEERAKELDNLMMRELIERLDCCLRKRRASLADFRYRALKASVPAATTLPADDPDSAGGGSSNPAGSATPMAGSAASNTAGGAFGATVTDSTITTTAAMDSAGSRRKIGVSPFADSAAGPSPFLSSIAGGPSPSNVSTDQIPIAILFESTSGGINEFFLESDEEEQIGMSRVVADPDSDDEVIAEIIFRGKSISGDGVVFVDKLPDDEIVDPRVKVETVSESASSPPRSLLLRENRRAKKYLYLLERVAYLMSIVRDLLLLRRRMKRQAYEVIASAPIACTARQMVFSSPWLTAKKESGSPLQTALVCFSNPLMVARLPNGCVFHFHVPVEEKNGKDISNRCIGCDGLPKTVRVFQFTLDSRSEKLDWLIKSTYVAAKTGSCCSLMLLPHLILLFIEFMLFHLMLLFWMVASTVSCCLYCVADGYIISADICVAAGSFVLLSSSIFADYFVSAATQSSCYRERSI